ncbi:hypothetical protein HAX54_026101 [Datura stramonium]|uniref:Uncharacterized protein n=1 Tax=Datura stramonium TaxID=4076 RepID=A0ABS8S7C1_DATST|nr:hypothetical protein [Datura stramonium]
MSVDAEFSNGPSILTDEKLPEVGNSAVACENASSSVAVVFTKETLNCPADKGQMEHTASEIIGIEDMSGESGGSDKDNDDKKLSNKSAEAANAGNSGNKLQCDQSEKTENADTDGGQGALSMVAEIKGVNEKGGDFSGDVNLVCEESADPEKVESNGQKAPSTEIKAVEEIMGESNGSTKNDKSVDAEKGDINSSMAIDSVTEAMVGMEEMRESSGPHRSDDDRRLSEESADTEKVESDGQREPIIVTEIKAIEEISGESNGSSKIDKSVDNEKGDISSTMAINPVIEIASIEETRGESNGPHRSNDDKRLSAESADTENVESNGQREPNTVTKIKVVEEIRGESNGSSKNDESMDDEKGDINSSMAIKPVTEAVCMEEMRGEYCGPHRSNDDRRLSEESAGAEKADSSCQGAPHLDMEMIRMEQMGCLSTSVPNSSEDKSLSDQHENAGNEDGNGQLALNMTKIKDINEIGGDSNCDVKLVCEGSADTEKVEINGERAPSTVAEIEEIRSESNGSSKIDESVDAEKAGSNNSMATKIVTEISGLEDQSNGVEKINIISEITGVNVESSGAEDISNDKLVHQESTNIGKADSHGQKVSNIACEIKGIEDIEGESDVTNKRTDVNSTSEDTKDGDVANSSTPVHKGEILCSIDAVASGTESVNNSDDAVQNVCNTVFDTICNEEIGNKSDGNKGIDDNAMRQRDEDSERLHSDGLASEGMSSDAELSHGPSILADARLSEVENSFTSISRDNSSDDAIALGNEACNSCISHSQSPADMVQEIIGKAVGGESNGVDRSSDDKLMCEEFEDDKRFNCSSPAAEGMSCNAEFSQGLSTSVDSKFSEVGSYCASSTKDVSSKDAVGAENEALNSSTDDSQLLEPNLIREGSGVENLEGELNGGDNSINNGILHKKCEDPENSHNGSDNVGAHPDAEFSIDQSVLADEKLYKAGNSSASSIKDECCDVVCGNTLNDPIHECKMVPDMATEFTDIKKEGESSVADQTSDDKFIRGSEDAEEPLSINIDERMSCNDEICHDQATLADFELSEVGNTSSSRDVSSYDAATFENETSTCPIEIDQESANMSIEIAGTEEMTGGSDRSSDDKLMCEQSEDAEISNTNEMLATSAECSSVDVAAVRDMNGIAAKGFYFLIRMPRFDDEKIRERIKVAELNVEEKTQHRDAFREKIRNRRANCQTHGAEFEAAKAQERDARKQVRTKRADISTLQDIIDKAKNAVAVGEIDNRICKMEHIIGHETVPLKEEKLLIREIKQLKQLRGQLSSNIGSQDEVQKSLDDRDTNEERLRALKKELDNLKVKASKAETIAMAASQKFEDESRKLKELQVQFKAADDIRQEAYEELRNLKKELYEKNIHFRTYKDEATLASDHARKREMEALNHLCVNQVERYMELWNKNDEFRKDYIRCNIRSTVRRFGTLDGRTLGPDEEPAVLPSYRVERVNRLVASVDKVNSVSQPPISQQEKQVLVLKDEIKDDNIVLQAAEGMNQVEKTKEARKPIQRERSTVDEPKEAEHLQTAQELEAARKEEELRKREEEARLKEQRRLEEITKAKEALERKKRNAEKAQLRAELRAQKEEEQRLKEREKRLRKKERKKGSISETQSESNDGETALISTSPRETVKEPEATENPQTTTKKPQKPSQYTKQMKTKSIPPPLRNRSRRKLQQWIWLTLSCIVVIALFFLGNIGFFSNLKPRRNPGF